MTKKQIYITGGAAGVILVILVAWIAYYGVKLKGTEEALAAEKASRATFEEESKTSGTGIERISGGGCGEDCQNRNSGRNHRGGSTTSREPGKVKAEIEAEKRETKSRVSRFGCQFGAGD